MVTSIRCFDFPASALQVPAATHLGDWTLRPEAKQLSAGLWEPSSEWTLKLGDPSTIIPAG